jgi:hypothetical protein
MDNITQLSVVWVYSIIIPGSIAYGSRSILCNWPKHKKAAEGSERLQRR